MALLVSDDEDRRMGWAFCLSIAWRSMLWDGRKRLEREIPSNIGPLRYPDLYTPPPPSGRRVLCDNPMAGLVCSGQGCSRDSAIRPWKKDSFKHDILWPRIPDEDSGER